MGSIIVKSRPVALVSNRMVVPGSNPAGDRNKGFKFVVVSHP